MRILTATDQWFPDSTGGAARLAAELAHALARRGHEQIVIAPRSGHVAELDGSVAVRRVLRRGHLPETFTDPYTVRRHARGFVDEFDVLLAHQSTMAAGLHAAWRATPLVFVYHGSAPRELAFDRARRRPGLKRLAGHAVAPRLRQLEARAVGEAARVVVLSDFSRSLLLEDHDVDPARIIVAHGGVDVESFTPGDGPAAARARLGVEVDGPLLFSARRLEPRKGVDLLLRAAALLPRHVSLAVAGSGTLAPDLERLKHALGLDGRVRLLGETPQSELRDWYRAADLFVLPTLAYEGFGLATIEALASGTPVVGTAVGATPELLRPLDPRLVVEESDPEALAAGIDRVLPLLGEELRARAREYACANFAWDNVVGAWEAVLGDASARRRPWIEPSVAAAPRSTRVSARRIRATDLLLVAGARPNFMKAAAIVRAAERAGLSYSLVHTGQHYDSELSEVFFADLGLPAPDVHLGVGSASHGEQTARIMVGFERELARFDPAVVTVVGDVNSTLACALVAVKEGYPVAHVEAGLRCHDRWMPEEINRKLCDHMAAYLFTQTKTYGERGFPTSESRLSATR
jgi:glycosyltransferase involved in cell wall biosynthesis